MIVDDHEVIRDALAMMLGPHGFETKAKCDSGGAVMSHIDRTDFDVVLLDVRLPDMDGLAVLEQLRSAKSGLPVVMFSGHQNVTYIARAVALGACDFLDKSADVSVIATALRCAADRGRRDGQSLLERVRRTMHADVDLGGLPPEMPLTSREAQVLRHIGFGLSNREIAGSLGISVETVKEHVQNVLRKMSANDRTDAAVRAVKAGLA